MSLIARVVYPFVETWLDYPDPFSNAVEVLFAGCSHGCLECHNLDLRNYDFADSREVFLDRFMIDLFDMCERCRTDKVVFSGGDPLFHKNIRFVKEFLLSAKIVVDVAVYTGYDIGFVKSNDVLGFTYIKTGKYCYEDRQIPAKTDKFFRLASKNQKIFNKSLVEVTDGSGVFYF